MCCTPLEREVLERSTREGEKALARWWLSNSLLKGKLSVTHNFFRGKTEKELNNLRQEIDILKGLYHENIILLLDSFETTHEFCMITEFA